MKIPISLEMVIFRRARGVAISLGTPFRFMDFLKSLLVNRMTLIHPFAQLDLFIQHIQQFLPRIGIGHEGFEGGEQFHT